MGFRRILLESAGGFPRPDGDSRLPLIVFGCEFHKGVCKACGLGGEEGDTVTCKLAETWALGKGHFRYARQGDDHF